jgi:hypothetical protein
LTTQHGIKVEVSTKRGKVTVHVTKPVPRNRMSA